MSTSINIRIEIVLLMAKFESPIMVKRKLQPEFGQDTPSDEEKVDEVRDFCRTESTTSVRAVVTAYSVPRTTTHRITTEYLSLKPYKAKFVQQIYEEDMQDRVEMCQTLIPMLEDNTTQDNVFFSDEATFYLNGVVNKHNIRYWCETNPHATVETVMNSPKVNV